MASVRRSHRRVGGTRRSNRTPAACAQPLLEPLEPRMLLSGDGLALAGTAPEISVSSSGGVMILDNDATPDIADGTDFGATTWGAAAIRTFTVRNTGNGFLVVWGLTLPNGFTLVAAPDSFIAPGATTMFSVRLDAASVGTWSGEVSFVTNDGDENPFNFAITGDVLVGAAPETQVEGNGVAIADDDATPDEADGTDFGTVIQDEEGPVRTFTVRNTGDATLAIDKFTVPQGFTVIEGLQSFLAPGDSDTFTLQLDTATPGQAGGLVSFSTNDTNVDYFTFAISGSVAVPEIDVRAYANPITDEDTEPIDFGTVMLGDDGPMRTFTVRNLGDGDLKLGQLNLPDGFVIFEGLNSVIPAGGSDNFTVTLDASAAGAHAGEISFSTNDADENPFNFAVAGTVVAAPTEAPQLLANALPDNTIGLEWSDVSDSEAGYRIERMDASGLWSQIATVAPDVTTYQDAGVTVGSLCRYRVRAYNAAGASPYSNEAVAAIVGSTPDYTDLGALDGKLSHTGSMGIPAESRTFRFTTTGAKRFRLTLKKLRANLDVELLDAEGNRITGSWNAGSKTEKIKLADLAAGTYYIRIFGAGTEFNLDLRGR